MPGVPATFNAEAGKPSELRNLRLAWGQLCCVPQNSFDFLSWTPTFTQIHYITAMGNTQYPPPATAMCWAALNLSQPCQHVLTKATSGLQWDFCIPNSKGYLLISVLSDHQERLCPHSGSPGFYWLLGHTFHYSDFLPSGSSCVSCAHLSSLHGDWGLGVWRSCLYTPSTVSSRFTTSNQHGSIPSQDLKPASRLLQPPAYRASPHGCLEAAHP